MSGGTRISFATKFDCWTGQPRRYTDVNNVSTDFLYDQPAEGTFSASMDRLVTVKSAVGLPVESQTNYSYGVLVPNVFVTAKSALRNANDELLETQTLFDGFGRATEQNQKNGAGRIRTRTEYDAVHRPFRRSNPSSSGSFVYTRTWFDALGRPSIMLAPDNARSQYFYGSNLQSTTDPAGVRKLTETDALGRLIRVIENPGQGLSLAQMAANPGAQSTTTRYAYSGDLLTVVCPQPGVLNGQACSGTNMVRTFTYDSSQRLKTVTQPESGPITYRYDEASSVNGRGQLTSRVRSQGVGSAVAVTTATSMTASAAPRTCSTWARPISTRRRMSPCSTTPTIPPCRARRAIRWVG